MKPLLTHELREDYEKKSNDCPFCHPPREQLVYTGEQNQVLLNKYPYKTGHLLITPLSHKRELDDLSNEELIELMNLVKKSVKVLKKTYDTTSFNIGLNLGEHSGGTIEHLHFHIVPRYENDTSFMNTTSNTTLIKESLNKTRERLLKEFLKQ